jgi:hypothetical protein
VAGTNFQAAARCRFGSLNEQAVTVDSSSRLRCLSPSQAAATYALEISNNNQDYTILHNEFLYYSACPSTLAAVLAANPDPTAPENVYGFRPTVGSIAGGTVITVTGTGFVDSYRLYCKFGTTVSLAATYVSSVQLLCQSNAVAGATTLTVQIANNNQDFTSAAYVFTYYGTRVCPCCSRPAI